MGGKGGGQRGARKSSGWGDRGRGCEGGVEGENGCVDERGVGRVGKGGEIGRERGREGGRNGAGEGRKEGGKSVACRGKGWIGGS